MPKVIEDRRARDWPELRSFVINCLLPFPPAKKSVIAALEEVKDEAG